VFRTEVQPQKANPEIASRPQKMMQKARRKAPTTNVSDIR